MALSTQPVKGARDFYPEDMRLRNYIFEVWREACENFGYEEYDAPILEPTELYQTKGNEEIIAEQTYSFTDRGGRNLTIRTEMTPSVSRMVAARRQELGYPLRLYSIPQCWRYERMQRGRGREFYQLNADVFGGGDLPDDLEIIQLSDSIMQRFGAKREMYTIQINSRKLTNKIFKEYFGLEKTQCESLIRLIDKLPKIERAEFIGLVDGLLGEEQRSKGTTDKLMQIMGVQSLEDLPDELKNSDEAVEIRELLGLLSELKISNAVFVPYLMRGFDYYTDITFEVIDTNPDNNRSMFGGGRYDGLVGIFGVEPVPTVGFGMGDITLKNFLEGHKLLPRLSPACDLFVSFLGIDTLQSQAISSELRGMGLNVAVDATNRKIEKQIKTAEKLGLRYVLFVGERELADQTYTLKDIESGEMSKHKLQDLPGIVKDKQK